MQKTILIPGSTDGIGLEAARMLLSRGHNILLHGRNPIKLEKVERSLSALPDGGRLDSYVADLSRLADVQEFAKVVTEQHPELNVLINNAGVYNAPDPVTRDGLDIRFAVNTIAPYLLTRRLLPIIAETGRVINLSSAAQSPVDMEALAGRVRLSDGEAYAQSKLALTAWSRRMGLEFKNKNGPVIVAVNPGSLLGTKMVKQAYGMEGKDIGIGANILCDLSLSDQVADATGLYFDNDAGKFGSPHPDALDPRKLEEIVRGIELVLADLNLS